MYPQVGVKAVSGFSFRDTSCAVREAALVELRAAHRRPSNAESGELPKTEQNTSRPDR